MDRYTEVGDNINKANNKNQAITKVASLSSIIFGASNIFTNCMQLIYNGYISLTARVVILLSVVFVLGGLAVSRYVQHKNREEMATTIAVLSAVLQLSLLIVVLLPGIPFDSANTSNNQENAAGATISANTSDTTQPSTDAPKQTETRPPAPIETTVPAIQPSIEIYFSSSADGVVKFNAVTVPEDMAVDWQSRDETIAAVDQEGRVSALSEGSVAIVASITFGGEVYSDEVTVTVTGEAHVNEKGTIRYFKSLPVGIDTEHSDFQNVYANEHIYPSQSDALKAVGLSDDTAVCADEKMVGYVYYHWCRGERLAETESHNRTSGATKDWHYSELLQKNVWCDNFSCFFSDVYLSESEMNFAADGSGSMWFENYAICNDSYWYWPTPIYECEYEVFQTRLSVDWKE